jgi:hypothetical protein
MVPFLWFVLLDEGATTAGAFSWYLESSLNPNHEP